MMNITKNSLKKAKKNFLATIVTFIAVLINISPVSAQGVDLAYTSMFVSFSDAFIKTSTIGTPIKKSTETIVYDNKTDLEDKAKRLDAYFAKRDMPLEGYGAKFVEIAERYDLDYRLMPAIGVRESSGGKHLLNNNPFGWGSAKIKFADFNEAIEVLGANLGGTNPNTSFYYEDKTTYEKLWAYNGTVLHSYPDEVIDIMNMF